jgi:hypothetical protein
MEIILMQIVSQSASLSHSLLPSLPLLSAPPPRKQLCAPRIAGLLPARTTAAQVEIISVKPPSRDELIRQLGPIRSREEMNAEIVNLMMDFLHFQNARHSVGDRAV